MRINLEEYHFGIKNVKVTEGKTGTPAQNSGSNDSGKPEVYEML